jgi:uncharacterized protein YbaR (Trm112 family)
MSDEISETLLDILVCPVDHGPLNYVASEEVLFNPRLNKAYIIRDGIPVLLEEESIDVDENKRAIFLEKTARLTGPSSI